MNGVSQADYFLPEEFAQRRYEALRTVYVEDESMKNVAQQFGLSYGTIRNWVSQFEQARQHPGFVETLEREEIVDFFTKTVQLTGFELDPSFDLTEVHRSW